LGIFEKPPRAAWKFAYSGLGTLDDTLCFAKVFEEDFEDFICALGGRTPNV
jgi:hypothetical protein